MSLENKVKELFKRVEKLEEENSQLRNEKACLADKVRDVSVRRSESKNEYISRRSFLRKLGVSAIGLGVLGAGQASALTLSENSIRGKGGINLAGNDLDLEGSQGGPYPIIDNAYRIDFIDRTGSGNKSKLEMNGDGGLRYLDGYNTELLNIAESGPIEIKNTEIDLGGNALESAPFRASGYNNSQNYRLSGAYRDGANLRTSFYSSSSSTGSESAWLPVYEFHHGGGINRHVVGTVKAHCIQDATGSYHFREEADFNSGSNDSDWGTVGNVVQNISSHIRLRVDDSDNSILRLELDLSNLSWPSGFIQVDGHIKCGGPVIEVYSDPN